jgi:hypothetical protein
MKSHNIVSALVLTAAAMLPFAASANNVSISNDLDFGDSAGVLHSKAKLNRNLQEGDYGFASTHGTRTSSFLDEWKFTLAQDSDVTINLFDLEVPLGHSTPRESYIPAQQKGGKYYSQNTHGWQQRSNSGKLLDNKYLTFSLFDHNGTLLGTAGEGGSLTALDLLAGEWYTLTVSAKVNGIFGSAYYGNLDINNVSEVPLGDSLPLFGSALLVLAIRGRKKIAGARH